MEPLQACQAGVSAEVQGLQGGEIHETAQILDAAVRHPEIAHPQRLELHLHRLDGAAAAVQIRQVFQSGQGLDGVDGAVLRLQDRQARALRQGAQIRHGGIADRQAGQRRAPQRREIADAGPGQTQVVDPGAVQLRQIGESGAAAEIQPLQGLPLQEAEVIDAGAVFQLHRIQAGCGEAHRAEITGAEIAFIQGEGLQIGKLGDFYQVLLAEGLPIEVQMSVRIR